MATDEGSAFLTPESAREKGLDFPEPPEYACPHCGRKLEPRGVALNGRIAWISHEPCGCEGELRAAEAEKAAEAASRLREEQVRRVNLLREAGITRRYENAEVFDRGALSTCGTSEAVRETASTSSERSGPVRPPWRMRLPASLRSPATR